MLVVRATFEVVDAMSLVARLRFDEVDVDAALLNVEVERVHKLHFRPFSTHLLLRELAQISAEKSGCACPVRGAVAALHTTKARHNHVPCM